MKNKIVNFDNLPAEEPPSKELQKVFKDIEKLDAEREAWQKMFNLQSNLVVGLEMDKIRLEKEVRILKKELEIYKDWLLKETLKKVV